MQARVHAELAAINNAATYGFLMLGCIVIQFTDPLLVDILNHLDLQHGVLALGGTASPQGGYIVIDHADELAFFCKSFKALRKLAELTCVNFSAVSRAKF